MSAVPIGGATKLPNNFFINHLLDEVVLRHKVRENISAVSYQSVMSVIGGKTARNGTVTTLSTTELLDSTTGQWFTCDDLPQPLACLQSVIVGDTLYTLGGSDDDDKASKAVYAASLYYFHVLLLLYTTIYI